MRAEGELVTGIIEGAIIALAGVLIGRFLPNRRKGPKPPKPVKPICGCEHHHAHHDPATGTCNASVDVPTRYDSYGIARAWKQSPCACRQYSGPVPMPEVYAPEISS
jgi:hypothetical protein